MGNANAFLDEIEERVAAGETSLSVDEMNRLLELMDSSLRMEQSPVYAANETLQSFCVKARKLLADTALAEAA